MKTHIHARARRHTDRKQNPQAPNIRRGDLRSRDKTLDPKHSPETHRQSAEQRSKGSRGKEEGWAVKAVPPGSEPGGECDCGGEGFARSRGRSGGRGVLSSPGTTRRRRGRREKGGIFPCCFGLHAPTSLPLPPTATPTGVRLPYFSLLPCTVRTCLERGNEMIKEEKTRM